MTRCNVCATYNFGSLLRFISPSCFSNKSSTGSCFTFNGADVVAFATAESVCIVFDPSVPDVGSANVIYNRSP